MSKLVTFRHPNGAEYKVDVEKRTKQAFIHQLKLAGFKAVGEPVPEEPSEPEPEDEGEEEVEEVEEAEGSESAPKPVRRRKKE